MTTILVDATTLIALGSIGELELLASLDGELSVLPSIRSEVTTEPAAANVERFLEHPSVESYWQASGGHEERAMEILGEVEPNGDVRVVAAVLAGTAADRRVAVVSDDRRLRTVARGLGAEVTGAIGVIVRSVEEGLPAEEGKAIVRRVDEHGLHMTAALRERAYELVDAAVE